MVAELVRQSNNDAITKKGRGYEMSPRFKASRHHDDDNDRKFDDCASLQFIASKASKTTNQLHQSSENVSGSTTSELKNKKDVWIGEMAPIGSSTTFSSDASSRDLSDRREEYMSLFENSLAKAAISAISSLKASFSSEQQLRQQLKQSLSGVRQEGDSVFATNDIHSATNPSPSGTGQILHKLVQEKQTECLILQQKNDSQGSEITQLQSIIDNLRENKKHQAETERHLRIALKRASQDVLLARDEANKAEASSAALTVQVDAFQKVVEETKRASVLLLQDQEEIGAGVEGMEKEFVEVQADLARHSATKQKMKQEQGSLSQKFEYMKSHMNKVQKNQESEQKESLLVKRKYKELQEKVEMEQSRSKRLQEDLDSTQTLLVDSTSTAAESKHALENCKQAFDRMEEANLHLHQQLQQQQEAMRKQEASHQEELNLTQNNHQEIKYELNNQNDRFRILKMEKLAVEKRYESLVKRHESLSVRLKESTNLMSTTVAIPYTSHPSTNGRNKKECVGNQNIQGTNREQSPKLVDNFTLGSSNPRSESMTKKCSICSKESSGLMKKCQCGRKGCKSRAHATCVEQSFERPDGSSHAYVPVILCRSSTS